jgi:hypothetical protein
MQQDFGDGGGALLTDRAGIAGNSDPFPGMQAAMGSGTYAPALKPVLLSKNADPLSQLRSLRQQLIRQQPPNSALHPAKHFSKP